MKFIIKKYRSYEQDLFNDLEDPPNVLDVLFKMIIPMSHY
jgi:hypothetical protein